MSDHRHILSHSPSISAILQAAEYRTKPKLIALQILVKTSHTAANSIHRLCMQLSTLQQHLCRLEASCMTTKLIYRLNPSMLKTQNLIYLTQFHTSNTTWVLYISHDLETNLDLSHTQKLVICFRSAEHYLHMPSMKHPRAFLTAAVLYPSTSY